MILQKVLRGGVYFTPWSCVFYSLVVCILLRGRVYFTPL